ncbi:hypothetical protein [Ramlibacter sp. PS4R-6]|uniref:hypothetical protein n=1 Tax=Ramlibacter sp. PS4R-6 TaxID=3133438 RepID=UPI0030A36264
MSNSQTSIGRGPASGGNENHDGDATRTTLGETVAHEPPAGADPIVERPVPEPGAEQRPDGNSGER